MPLWELRSRSSRPLTRLGPLFVGLASCAPLGEDALVIAYAATALFLSECGLWLEPRGPVSVQALLGSEAAWDLSDVAGWIRRNVALTRGPRAHMQRAATSLVPAIRRGANLTAGGATTSGPDIEAHRAIGEIARQAPDDLLRLLVQAVLVLEGLPGSARLSREGLSGAAVAVSKFDGQGPFETYVRWWITQFVRRAARAA